ncbi:DUF6160 family protein [Alkalimarinus coralli]|uniref:DUF6160 family protein n=1 Tax=Alkalimarinus coralli TaxID=2935863 RepID=UPI00202AE189|nr:DUF6160 family protein [Alkalimarinus coralli]
MNNFKKIALVTAISSAPLLAQAELKPMDDTLMSDISGQAGITLEVGAHVEFDSIVYTDTKENASDTKGGGQLAIKNIAVGGSDIWDPAANSGAGGVVASSTLDDLTFDIDINDQGELIVDMTGPAVDYGITLGSVELQKENGDSSFTLLGRSTFKGQINNLDLTLHKEDKTAFGGSASTDVLQANIEFNIQDMDLDVAFLGLQLEDVAVSGAGGDKTDFVVAEIDLYQDSGKMVLGLSDVAMDVNIGAIKFGGTSQSMGSVDLNNMRITNTTFKLSAH